MSRKRYVRHRSAVTGKYVSEGYAKRYPDKTIKEKRLKPLS
jgi:hypothetical protein